MDNPPPGFSSTVKIIAIDGPEHRERIDDLATEEPLELRLQAGGRTQSIAVTMRTPGNDFELAAGFLLAEGIIVRPEDIGAMSYCIDEGVDPEQRYNIVNITLARGTMPDTEHLERHFTMSSACGICGKATLEALHTRSAPLEDRVRFDIPVIMQLPARMRAAQRVFASTGGLHAAAIFDNRGELLVLREDVGRHNALDKAIGWSLLNREVSLHGCVALVSGRASYELVQKCIVARLPVLCAVSAPSSLAVELAAEFDLTLLGFLRAPRANVYSGSHRLVFEEAP
ncbi:MAG: formate dehydrogenase accessory sulfurtransferase FdhD [Candidatus Eremiobacteraeota bacterium]|nr:formate dehydrogenase accessory sulfurtransferase FdhD [Candidatus Eremiobacteraeota bacterium]